MRNLKFLCALVLLCFSGWGARGQEKVAQYAVGNYGKEGYEELSFWAKDGKRGVINYSYGKENRELTLHYLRRDTLNGEACFVVQFPNGYTLFVKPVGLTLQVTDAAGKYNKTFSWEYEGPVNGIGTFCRVCAADDREAMKIIKASYLK